MTDEDREYYQSRIREAQANLAEAERRVESAHTELTLALGARIHCKQNLAWSWLRGLLDVEIGGRFRVNWSNGPEEYVLERVEHAEYGGPIKVRRVLKNGRLSKCIDSLEVKVLKFTEKVVPAKEPA